jgi:hypothetical protein
VEFTARSEHKNDLGLPKKVRFRHCERRLLLAYFKITNSAQGFEES